MSVDTIDVTTQTQLWAETYDREIGDVLLTERDVAMRVAESLAMSVLRTNTAKRRTITVIYDAVRVGSR